METNLSLPLDTLVSQGGVPQQWRKESENKRNPMLRRYLNPPVTSGASPLREAALECAPAMEESSPPTPHTHILS